MKIGSIVIAIFAVFLLLGYFATPILNGIKGWRTGGTTTQTMTVATAGGVTSANVTLSKDLYQSLVTNIISITSSDGTDTPATGTYTEATKVLEITGLEASTSRTLTLSYYGETDDSVMRIIGPFLGFLIIGGLVVLLIMGVTHKGGGRR